MQLPKKEDSLSRFSPIPVVLLKIISHLLLLRVSMKFFHFSCKRISQGESIQQSTPTSEVLNLKSLQFTMPWGRGGKVHSRIPSSAIYISSSCGCSFSKLLPHIALISFPWAILLRHITFSRELFLILPFP